MAAEGTFYPDSGDAAPVERAGAPEWMALVPAGGDGAATEGDERGQAGPHETPAAASTSRRPLVRADEPERPGARARRVLRGLAAGSVLALVGTVLYASLYVLVGQEILAAALMIGVLAGAGMRIGGAREGWLTAYAASAVALAAWCLGVAVGRALLESTRTGAAAMPAVLADLATPIDMVRHCVGHPLILATAVLLVTSGAIVATATYSRRR